jgi:hypothetical protein
VPEKMIRKFSADVNTSTAAGTARQRMPTAGTRNLLVELTARLTAAGHISSRPVV